MSSIADAYSTGAGAWEEGPIRIYRVLAELLVARAPVPLRGRRLLDLGTGTGAASRPALTAGARVTAVDTAFGMLALDRSERPPGVVGDALSLPFRSGAFGGVVAAFSLNHLVDAGAGVREAHRVIGSGGFLLASTYANDDDHPVKQAVERALGEQGWEAPGWYPETKRAMAAWGTIDAATAAVERGGMDVVSVEHVKVPFPELAPEALVDWRLGMAQCANFVAALDGDQRAAVMARAREMLGPEPEPLVRCVLFIVARTR